MKREPAVDCLPMTEEERATLKRLRAQYTRLATNRNQAPVESRNAMRFVAWCSLSIFVDFIVGRAKREGLYV